MSSITLNSNISSLTAKRRLGQSTAALTSSFERLSSGLRINRASDDAAGLSISSSLNADARIFGQGVRNLNDGISVLSIADSALTELSNIVVRLQELAERSANGTFSNVQRQAVDAEGQALREEYQRISETTRFNQLALLNGDISELTLQAGYGASSGIEISLGEFFAREAANGSYEEPLDYFLTANDAPGYLYDVDFDGDLDLFTALAASSPTIRILENDGTGNFGVHGSFNPATTATNNFIADSIVVSNFDHSAGLEFSVQQGGQYFVYRYFCGVFSQEDAFFSNVALGDFNADGIEDQVYKSSGTELGFNLSSAPGAGIYTPDQTISGVTETYVASGDINGDGIDDVYVTGGGTASVVFGSASETFVEQAVSDLGQGYLGDIDGDGKADFVSLSGGELEVHIGNGDGSFKSAQRSSTGGAVTNLGNTAIQDINQDGFDDVTASTSSGILTLLGSSGGFTEVEDTHSLGGSGRLINGDLNGDNINDIIAGSARDALDTFQTAALRLRQELGSIGALQSRIDVAVSVLGVARENYTSAQSRITDVDIATESANLVRNQILQQAGTAVLAQANAQPRITLDLLGGL